MSDAAETRVIQGVDPSGPQKPKTLEEARFFHDGFLCGLTAYANALGHSALKSENDILRSLADDQGWKTIETYEDIARANL